VGEPISGEDFLDKKKDYSPLLVHLTREGEINGVAMTARYRLNSILSDKTLKAFNYKYCLFCSKLNSLSESMQDKFKVVCFTETPLDQIDILLTQVYGRNITFAPYGLVFKKEYIRQMGGNPVFYVGEDLFSSFWDLYDTATKRDFSKQDNKLLALVNKCDETIDFHWEREWRIVGNLEFSPAEDIYCGLCPEEDMLYFESNYPGVKFISPTWGINKILDKLVKPNQ
jgi:hypothetical protein